MMKVGHPSKLRVLVITLIFGSVMVLAQAKPAHANFLAGQGLAYILIFVVQSLYDGADRQGPIQWPEDDAYKYSPPVDPTLFQEPTEPEHQHFPDAPPVDPDDIEDMNY